LQPGREEEQLVFARSTLQKAGYTSSVLGR
jgi:hypothetical protein